MMIKGLTSFMLQIAHRMTAWRTPFLTLLFTFLLSPALLTGSAHAAEAAKRQGLTPVSLSNDTSSIKLGLHTFVVDDTRGQITRERILQTAGQVFNTNGRISQEDIVYMGHDGASRWIIFRLINNSTQPNWVLDMGSLIQGRIGSVKSVTLYEMPLKMPGSSDQPAFYLKEVKIASDGRHFRMDLTPASQKLMMMHINAVEGLPTTLPLNVYSPDHYIDEIQSRANINSGLCIVLGAFGMFFFLLSVQRRQFYNITIALYFLFMISFYLLSDSVGATLGSEMYKIFHILMLLGFTLMSIIVTQVFCKISHILFTERYILHGLFIVNILVTVFISFLSSQDTGVKIAILQGAPLATLFILALMSFAQTYNGRITGYHFFLSWIFPIIGLTITALASARVLPLNPWALNAFWFSFVPQGFFLTLAMNKRFFAMEETDRMNQSAMSNEALKLNKLKQAKETGDHSRLLKVIEKEREMLADFREKEAARSKEMRRAKEAADEANRAKSAFLAVVSHEIRTPMTGIMGMVRLLLESQITKQQKDYVLTIQDSGDAMLGLLNDILDFEKIQRGKMDLENISFDLHRMVQGVVTLMSGHATVKNITLSARVDDDLPRFVKGDPTRLRQVLLNLMGNALKFTEQGGVTLLVKTLGIGDNDDKSNERYMIYFAVQDTGIGIPEAAQQNLFSPFAQADSSISRKFGGTGLGLAISKGLIEAMGSSVNISSKDGEGSTFFFTLEMEKGLSTLQRPAGGINKPAETTGGREVTPMRILVVDDNAINRKVITSFLEQDKHSIATSGTAEDALNKIDKEVFDVILMDIELPGMMGHEATRVLREHKDKHKASIPVIALTGNVGREDMEVYLAHGMNALIGKPIDPDKLKSMVAEIGNHSFEREIKSPGSAAQASQSAPAVASPPSAAPQAIQPSVVQAAQDTYIPSTPPAPAPVTAPAAVEEIVEKAEAKTSVFNPEMLQSLKDTIGTEQLSQLLEELLVKTEEIVGAMERAAAENDMTALAARSHELKGMAGNFGLTEISAIAAETEKKVKAHQIDGLLDLVGTLPGANVRAVSVLKDWASA